MLLVFHTGKNSFPKCSRKKSLIVTVSRTNQVEKMKLHNNHWSLFHINILSDTLLLIVILQVLMNTKIRSGGGGLVTNLCPTLATPWTIAHHASLSMRFPRKEYWSGLPFPSPGYLPNPGIEPESPVSPAFGRWILYWLLLLLLRRFSRVRRCSTP